LLRRYGAVIGDGSSFKVGEGKNGGLGPCPQWSQEAKPLVKALGAKPSEADDNFL